MDHLTLRHCRNRKLLFTVILMKISIIFDEMVVKVKRIYKSIVIYKIPKNRQKRVCDCKTTIRNIHGLHYIGELIFAAEKERGCVCKPKLAGVRLYVPVPNSNRCSYSSLIPARFGSENNDWIRNSSWNIYWETESKWNGGFDGITKRPRDIRVDFRAW